MGTRLAGHSASGTVAGLETAIAGDAMARLEHAVSALTRARVVLALRKASAHPTQEAGEDSRSP